MTTKQSSVEAEQARTELFEPVPTPTIHEATHLVKPACGICGDHDTVYFTETDAFCLSCAELFEDELQACD